MKMFKEDAIFKITLSNIKKHKNLYRNVFFTICFSFIWIILINIVSSSLNELSMRQKQQVFGNWTMISDTLTDEMKNDEHITLIGEINRIDDNLGSYDSNMFTIEGHLIEGELPKNNKEIIIEKTTLSNLGYKQQLNQTITYNNQQYKLVGIVDDVSLIWDISVPTMITVDENTNNQEYFIVSDDTAYCLNKYADKDTIYNSKIESINETVTYDDNVEFYITNNQNQLIENIVIFMSILGVLSCLLLVNYKRKKQVILLKNIGTTNNQLIKMMFYECLILLIPAFIIGLLISLIISYIIMILFTKQSHLPMIYILNYKEILFNVFVILLSIIFMYFIAYIQIFKFTIDGTTKQGKKKLKKYHKTNYYLLKRMKKTHIIVVACIILFHYITMNVYSSYYEYQTQLKYLNDYKQYQYYLSSVSDEGISEKEILNYFNKDEVSYNQNDKYEDGITFTTNYVNSQNKVLKSVDSGMLRITTINIDHDEYYKKQIENSLYSGRMIENDDEGIIYIPYNIDYSLLNSKKYYQFELGQTVYLEDNTPIHIVGIVYDRLTLGYDISNTNPILSSEVINNYLIINENTYQKSKNSLYNNIYVQSNDLKKIKEFMKQYPQFSLIINDNYMSINESEYLQNFYINIMINGSLFILCLYLLILILKNIQYEYDKEYNVLLSLGALKKQILSINLIEILILMIPTFLYLVLSYINTGYVFNTYIDYINSNIIIITIIDVIILIIIQIRCVLFHLNKHIDIQLY
jgi:hypothetical protein